MAVLAPPADWNPPRYNTIDVPSTVSRQRSSPANDSPMSTTQQQQQQNPQQGQPQQQQQAPPSQQQPQFIPPQPQQQQQQSPYPYPIQQQPQGGWTPSITAQPFYPSFYQNHSQPQQPYPIHAQSPQNPFFDPSNNVQLAAQWAYQQMMFGAHPGFPRMSPQQQQSPQQLPQRSGTGPSHADYFAQNQLINSPYNNGFPSGTPPPPHPNASAANFGRAGSDQQQYVGFHPYRRPTRQQSTSQEQSGGGDWRSTPQRPYARPEASASSSSVNSTSSATRQRTDSNQSSNSATASPSGSVRARNTTSTNAPSPASLNPRGRSSSSSSSPSSVAPPTSSRLHNRNGSSSSTGSTPSTRPSLASNTSAGSSSTPSSAPSTVTSAARPARPSPLSQGTFTASEKRMSRDDIDLAAMLDPPQGVSTRSGGLKGRLRRALSFNSNQVLIEAAEDGEDNDDASIKASSSRKVKPKAPESVAPKHSIDNVKSDTSAGASKGTKTDDAESAATVQTKKKSRAASLFNSRMNMSTDNISLSSTVSSASVMIRKLGSMGKLARRNSLAGITSLFKDKKDKEDANNAGNSKDKKGKQKKNGKAEVSEASVSHVTAELDRNGSDWSSTTEMAGLSPAAKLARQHTLKTNAEAAAKAKAQQEAAEATTKSGGKANGHGVANGVPTWDRNTATGQGSQSPAKAGAVRVSEDGTRVWVEDDDDGSDDGSGQDHYSEGGAPIGGYNNGWGDDDDDDWDGDGDDEDMTIRQTLDNTHLDAGEDEELEPWAINVRRSVERTRTPTKGILKYAAQYDQGSYLAENPGHVQGPRMRANSYDSHPGQTSELGPLAHIPSPDPDHIDGLHRHGSHSSSHAHSNAASGAAPSLPPLSFESGEPTGTAASWPSADDGPHSDATSRNGSLTTSPLTSAQHPPSPSAPSMFSHPNSSAPALSTILSTGNAPALSHRSATAPSKRLAFANNLSVYDTFPPSVYDRRSEPATWSRLTPALAQRIKEELNSYKMEEMEVHAASRIHTQFFV